MADLVVDHALPVECSGQLSGQRTLPLAMWGTDGVVHEWSVLRPATGVFLHAWNVAEIVQSGEFVHTWSILVEEDGTVSHLWRVLQPGLIVARSQDIQLPYATKTITTSE